MEIEVVENFSNFDTILVISPPDLSQIPTELQGPIQKYLTIDPKAIDEIFIAPTYNKSGQQQQKLVFSGVGKLENDYDDVKSYAKAAKNGIKKALDSGSKVNKEIMSLISVHFRSILGPF